MDFSDIILGIPHLSLDREREIATNEEFLHRLLLLFVFRRALVKGRFLGITFELYEPAFKLSLLTRVKGDMAVFLETRD